MTGEFPYQVVAFLDNEPHVGESVYEGVNGWYPQIALKRRFKLVGISQEELLGLLEEFCLSCESFEIEVKDYTKPDRMPVGVLEVVESPKLMEFHSRLIRFMGSRILSRYPERDGDNYLPHITADYSGKRVINIDKYKNKNYKIDRIWLLKDEGSEDSVAKREFSLIS